MNDNLNKLNNHGYLCYDYVVKINFCNHFFFKLNTSVLTLLSQLTQAKSNYASSERSVNLYESLREINLVRIIIHTT